LGASVTVMVAASDDWAPCGSVQTNESFGSVWITRSVASANHSLTIFAKLVRMGAS